MNAELAATRLGLRRGWIELRQMYTTPSELAVTLLSTAVFLAVMLFMRTRRVPGTGFSLGTTELVSVLGMNVGFNGMAMLAGVLALGLTATLPIGAVLGSLFPSARSAGLLPLLTSGLVAISGIFYPITHLPPWLQWIGQAFPLYWLGLGMRSALLPPSLASVEIGHSWRHLATFGVLAGWTAVGLMLAPVVLRRMARRESGSTVAARRERVLLRA